MDHIGAAATSTITTHRQCTIDIKNACSSHALTNPRMFILSGQCPNPLTDTVGPSKETSALFIKTAYGARGAVGVFTYDLVNADTNECTGKKIAVMFSVPFDYSLYVNVFSAGFFATNRTCDTYLYNEMYHNSGRDFVTHKASDPITVTYGNFTITATMPDTCAPVIKVEIHDNLE